MMLQCEVVTSAGLLDRMFGGPQEIAVVAAITQFAARIERGAADCLCCGKRVRNDWQTGPDRAFVGEVFVVNPPSAGGEFLISAVCRQCAGKSVPEYVECLVGAGGLPRPLRVARIMDEGGNA